MAGAAPGANLCASLAGGREMADAAVEQAIDALRAYPIQPLFFAETDAHMR